MNLFSDNIWCQNENLNFFLFYNVHYIAQRNPTLAAEVSGEFLL